MFFTKNDFDKIAEYLKSHAKKDTDFVKKESVSVDSDILTVVSNGVNYKIHISDLLKSGIPLITIDKLKAVSIETSDIKVTESITVDANNIHLNNDKGTTLLDILNYFENNKLDRHNSDTFKGDNLTIEHKLDVKEELNIQSGRLNIKEVPVSVKTTSTGNNLVIDSDLTILGDIKDGKNNILNDTTLAAKGWKIELGTPSSPSVRESYYLKDYKGNSHGLINIYKDSTILDIKIGYENANYETPEGQKPYINPGTHEEPNDDRLCILYSLSDGTLDLVKINLSAFLTEAEVDLNRGLGVDASTRKIYLKLADDDVTKAYISFNENTGALSAAGIEDRILLDLGTITDSLAGDSTMWGLYKLHEGTLENSLSYDNSRWGIFKEAEEVRNLLVSDEINRIQTKVDEVNLETIKEAQDAAIQAIADREIEILSKTDATLISTNTESLEGNNVQANLNNISNKFTKFESDTNTKLTELEGNKQDKDAEVYSNNSKEFFITDANGHIVAKIGSYGIVGTSICVKYNDEIKNLIDLLSQKVDKDGDKVLSEEDFTTKLKSALEGYCSSIIDSEDGFYITDAEGYVAFMIKPNGNVDFNGKPASGLEEFELFSLGDSLSYGGVWQEEVTRLTGCKFRQELNIKAGHQLSSGGTTTYGDGFDTAVWRTKNLIDAGYISNGGENAIIILENVNDLGEATAFEKDAISLCPDTPIEGYTTSQFNEDMLASIPVSQRSINACFKLLRTTNGKNLAINSLPSKNGAVTLKIFEAGTGTLEYNIQVLSTDNKDAIISKILEYNYTKVIDTLADDEISVNFVGSNISVTFEDTDNTGMSCTITDTSNAKSAIAVYFIGSSLDEWTDTSKWMYGGKGWSGSGYLTLSIGYKSVIERLQKAYPRARIMLAMFPAHSVTSANYLLPNGLYDTKSYNETDRVKNMEILRGILHDIADYYHIPFLDIYGKCGISINNMLEYYNPSANVHPKESGYIKFGKTVAAELMSNIK